MSKRLILFGLFTALSMVAPGTAADDTLAKRPFVVHEWGTFLAVQGSDGVTLGGMVDSDEVLPAFVETMGPISMRRLNMTCKMETPVTYFYTDKPRTVQVCIAMPKGLLTHWYPFVKAFGPYPTVGLSKPENGVLEWRNVQLLPGVSPDRLVSPVGANQSWRFARETDSSLVKVVGLSWNERERKGEKRDQYEKFLFYRGLGNLNLPLSVQSFDKTNDATTLKLTNESTQPLVGVFLIQVGNQTIRFGAAGDLGGHGSRSSSLPDLLGNPLSLSDGIPLVKQAVAGALVDAGLYEKEAQAMVNTWEKSYFRTDGLRVLYLLPRTFVDATIPIMIQPPPDQLVRVMVGRVEVLTPERERQIEHFISQLGAADFRVRQEASTGLSHLGRIGEPALRRVAKTTTDPEVRARAAQLIQQFESR